MPEPRTYEFLLRGVVSDRTARTFEELDLRCDTVVRGVVQDRSALHGLLERIRDLGLDLLQVRQVGSDTVQPEHLPVVDDRTDPRR